MGHASFGPMWPGRNPNIVTLVRSDGLRLPVHRELLDLTKLLIDFTELMGYDVIPGQTWGYAFRAISGTNTPSNHSQGTADDVNAPSNPYASTEWHHRNARGTKPFGLQLVCDIPQKVIELWEDYGYFWGGRYKTKPDPMHLEFLQSVLVARQMTAKFKAWVLANSNPTPVPVDPTPIDSDEEDDLRPRTLHFSVPATFDPEFEGEHPASFPINLPQWERKSDYNFKRAVFSAGTDPGVYDPEKGSPQPMKLRIACLGADGKALAVYENVTNQDVEKARGLNAGETINLPAGTRIVNVQNYSNIPAAICIELFPA